jgi:cyclophilin family peptidyl-prolyl cis-trans isomerase
LCARARNQDYTRDGKGHSAFADEQFFPQENFSVSHDRPGIVSMISITAQLPGEPAPRVMNSSLFIITNKALPKLDGQQVAVGCVTHGLEVVERICAECAFQAPDTAGVSKTVVITECGRLA